MDSTPERFFRRASENSLGTPTSGALRTTLGAPIVGSGPPDGTLTTVGDLGDRVSLRTAWRNVPVPEPHVAGLLAGAVLQQFTPWRITRRRGLVRAPGSVLFLFGVVLAVWAVRTVADVDTADPSDLVTDGPYAHSRNPMYVAWTLLYAGVSLLANAAWPLALLPAVAVRTHAVVLGEERALEAAFGEEYREYADDVPRYLSFGGIDRIRHFAGSTPRRVS